MKIQGSIVALVTPMNADGSVDLDSMRRLMDWQIEEGTDAFVIVGTTGESPTVNVDEHAELIRGWRQFNGRSHCFDTLFQNGWCRRDVAGCTLL